MFETTSSGNQLEEEMEDVSSSEGDIMKIWKKRMSRLPVAVNIRKTETN